MKSNKTIKLGESGITLLKIIFFCVILAEYILLLLLYTKVISPERFFLQAHAFRESCYISAVLALGGVLLADIEDRKKGD